MFFIGSCSIKSLLILVSFILFILTSTDAEPVGVCYGRVANNLPPPSTVVKILKPLNVTRARLFDTNPDTLKAFANSGIELLIDIRNEELPSLSTNNSTFAQNWLQSNILAFLPPEQIRYIAVGNEIFLKDPYYTPHVVPAMTNLYQALLTLNLATKIKLSSPHAASVLAKSNPPSAGEFDPYVKENMTPLLRFLQDSWSSFMVNLYPYLSYASDSKNLPIDFALFNPSTVVRDAGMAYTSLFDASLDAFVYAMEREGFGGVPVVVSETGWPTEGGIGASKGNAEAFNGKVAMRSLRNVGTPKRPGVGLEIYLFDAFDEDEKTGETYEKHFGIFAGNGDKKYEVEFS